jgi:hypothetical protein
VREQSCLRHHATSSKARPLLAFWGRYRLKNFSQNKGHNIEKDQHSPSTAAFETTYLEKTRTRGHEVGAKLLRVRVNTDS